MKFIGDSILVTFPADRAVAGVDAAIALRAAAEALGREVGIPVAMGVNVHLGTVVDAHLGKGASRRRDVVGRVVNQAFLMGRGPGVRLSEPVYRKLPSGARTPWTRNKPPAVYVLEEETEPLAGRGKSPAENAARW